MGTPDSPKSSSDINGVAESPGVPPALLEKLKLLPLRERELVTLRQIHQHHLRWIQGSQELMVRLSNASTIPEGQGALLRSLVEEFGFDISGASMPETVLAGDPVHELTATDRLLFEQVINEVRRTRSLVISQGEDLEGNRTLGWLMGGLAGTTDTGHEHIVVVGRTRRTASYYPPPKDQEAGLYRHLLSTVEQVFRSISLQSTHNYELERKVVERTRELREAQERVVQLEREKIAEQMAGGFAHEMRNALSGAKILMEKGMAEGTPGKRSLIDRTAGELKQMLLIAREKLDAEALATFQNSLGHVVRNERLLEDVLQSTSRSIQRALSITNLIMEYSRIGYSQPGSDFVDLGALARAIVAECAADFAQHRVSASVSVDGRCMVRGSEAHFYSILKNLVVNAFDALCEVEDHARSRDLVVDVRRVGDRIVVRVVDSANGVPEETRSRIFEPFFTTKPQTGTGLGLGMVQKLVALHGGTLQLDSEVGRGATFTLSFAEGGETDKNNDVRAAGDASRTGESCR